MQKVQIGIDLGGTNVRIGVVANLKVLASFTTKTAKDDYRPTLAWIGQQFAHFKTKYLIEKVGMCVPGPLDLKTGLILESPNLPAWNGLNLQAIMGAQLGQTVNFNNDANAQALALQKIYAPQAKVLVFLTISTGIGCGIILDGAIFNGAHGFAGEVANINVSDLKSGYGALTDGAVESLASGTGLATSARRINKDYTAEDVFTNAALKDLKMTGVKALAKLLTATISLLDPDTFIFAGSVAIHHPAYLQKALALSRQQLFKVVQNQQKVIFAAPRQEYGIIGASLI